MPYQTKDEYTKVLEEYNKELLNYSEIWLPLKYKNVCDDSYMISNHGRVYSIYRDKVLKPVIRDKTNTVQYGLACEDRKLRIFTINRLVAHTFIPIPNELLEKGYDESSLFVMYKNGIRTCSAFFNLKWVIPGENIIHAHKLGLIQKATGENCHTHRLTESDVHEICKLLERGLSYNEIINMLDISIYMIKDIKLGKTWKHISSQYNINIPHYTRHIITDELVHSICKELQDTDLTLNQIAQKYNVSRSTVTNIKCGKLHTNISKNYNTNNNRRYNNISTPDNIVNAICKDLQDGMKTTHIAKKYNICPTIISNIKRHKTYKYISKYYKF